MTPHKHLRNNLVARARDKGATLTYWFYIKIGRKWVDFDIRTISQIMDVKYPDCLDRSNYVFGSSPRDYSETLSKELKAVSDWVSDNHKRVTTAITIDRSVNKT